MSILTISAIPCEYDGVFVSMKLSLMIQPYRRAFEVKNVTQLAEAVEQIRNDPNVAGKDMQLCPDIKQGRKPPGFDTWLKANREALNLRATPKEAAPAVAVPA